MKTLLVLFTVLLALSLVGCLRFERFSIVHYYNTFTNTSLLYYGESGDTEDQNVLGTPSTPFSTGLVLHPTKVPARRGFFLEASWQPSECDASNITSPSLGADGY